LKTDEIILQTASAEELLVLKMVAEDLSPSQVAESEGLPVQKIREAFQRAAAKGFVLTAPSSIQRDPRNFPRGEIQGDAFFSSPYFSLQWHLTQACDLHCKHCYDRSSRSSLPLGQSLKVLDGLESFCQKNNVLGHISFTGGNPFLHPNFFEIYQEAARKGFTLAVLGNPVDREKIEKILAIQEPAFFQVSLEGLADHNDDIRGDGHFDRTMKFLEVLKKLKVYSMVMLTLTKDNLDQVLPLGEILKDRTESFFFNRLSPVGEGAHLQLPDKKDYQAFLKTYLEAMKENPVLGLKDNLFNIFLHLEKKELFGGCAGYGCSAAFNFLTLLPDGEVQACRKFPSKIGNILEKSLLEIYDSDQARRYRAGSAACAPCPIRPVCGGCLAVAHGLGLNIFEDRDPFCFYP
jgi:selenobiotic family peptide radical SAM maturase